MTGCRYNNKTAFKRCRLRLLYVDTTIIKAPVKYSTRFHGLKAIYGNGSGTTTVVLAWGARISRSESMVGKKSGALTRTLVL